MTAFRRCAICGHSIRPAGYSMDTARYAKRVCCSRRCALKMPPRPETIAARSALHAELTKRVPDAINAAGVVATRAWINEPRRSLRWVKWAGADACRRRLELLQKAARGETVA
jgi:hypothetical protein